MQDWRTDTNRLLNAAREELSEQSPRWLADKLIEARNEAIRNEQACDNKDALLDRERAVLGAISALLRTLVPASADPLEMMEAVRVELNLLRKHKGKEVPF